MKQKTGSIPTQTNLLGLSTEKPTNSDFAAHVEFVKKRHEGIPPRGSCFLSCSPSDMKADGTCRPDCPLNGVDRDALPSFTLPALPASVPCTGLPDCCCPPCLKERFSDLPF